MKKMIGFILFLSALGLAAVYGGKDLMGGPPVCTPESPGWKYMAGFDHNKLKNPAHRTVKYEIGRIVCQYLPTPANLKELALPQIQRRFPGTTLRSKDKIKILGIGIIDVIQAAGEGGKAWQWLPVSSSASALKPSAKSSANPSADILQNAPHMMGWDMKKLMNPEHHSPKYNIGRILLKHQPSRGQFVSTLKKILPEIRDFSLKEQKPYSKTEIVGTKGDKLKIPGVGTVDVIQDAGSGGVAWQWLEP